MFIIDKRIIQCNFVHYLSIPSRLAGVCFVQAWFNIDHRISNFFPE
ncbi:tryptophanase leader peptide [Morganella morganii]|nr:tryptophanase leader peptide [Morganella morganii]